MSRYEASTFGMNFSKIHKKLLAEQARQEALKPLSVGTATFDAEKSRGGGTTPNARPSGLSSSNPKNRKNRLKANIGNTKGSGRNIV